MYLIMKRHEITNELDPVTILPDEHHALLAWATKEGFRLRNDLADPDPMELSFDYTNGLVTMLWIEGELYHVIECELGKPISVFK